jgi:hypothetical protein
VRLQVLQKLVKILPVVNVCLGVVVIALGVKLVLSFGQDKPKGQGVLPKEIVELSQKPKKKEPEKITEGVFILCFSTPILEEKPIVESKPAPIQSQPQPETPIQLPFQWVGVMVHSNRENSYAIILDKGTQQQILVKEGNFISGTTFKVINIAKNRIQIQLGNKIAILEQPKIWEELIKHDKSDLTKMNSSTNQQESKLIIGNTLALSQYGLKPQDQIISVGGKRVQSLSHLQEILATLEKSVTEILVLRAGRIVSVVIPKEIVGLVLASVK